MGAGSRSAAILMAILLLLSWATIAAAKPEGGGKRGFEGAPGEIHRWREKAEQELVVAEDLLEKAMLYLDELGNKSSTKISKLVAEAKKNLDKAKELLERDPARSLALSKHVQALMRLIIRVLEGGTEKLGGENKSMSPVEDLEKSEAEVLPEESEGLLPPMASNASREVASSEVVVKENYTVNASTSYFSMNFSVNATAPKEGVENETVVVKALRLENDTIREETMMVSGNRTIIVIRRGPDFGNESIEVQVAIEKNQSVIGAFIEVKPGKNVFSKLIDETIRIEPAEIGENRFKFQVSAPNGTTGRLIIIRLDPEVFTVDEIDEVRVLVNGSTAILASSIIDLFSEVYEEPAYVFVISSEGVSVLIYLPHFSSYTIDIIGVIREMASSMENFLSQVLARDTFVASTILATVILMVSATLYVRRKSLLYRI